MKIKKLLVLSGLLFITSCGMFHSGHDHGNHAHDKSKSCDGKQCQMKDGKKSCCQQSEEAKKQ